MAEAAYKAAIEAGGSIAALGYEGLAQVAKIKREDPQSYLQSAMHAGSKSAPVYVAAALDQPAEEALPLLKKASQLNPLWAEPFFRQAQFAADLKDKEAFIKKATQLDPRISQYWIELAQVQVTNGHASLAQGSWLRAEDSAKNEAERERIHKLHMDSEKERLDAMEAERRREREEAHLADQRAQDAEANRIHAAEEKANNSVGEAPIGEVVPWNSVVPKKKILGVLTQVDCLHSGSRILVKSRAGQTVSLFLKDAAALNLSCGAQTAPRRVAISYLAQPDDMRHTLGDVTEFAWQ